MDPMYSLMLVSSIFGPYMFIMGLWMLIHRQNCQKIMDSIRKTPAAIYVMGWTSLLLGLFIINQFNEWNFENITIFVTLLGWAYFVRAIIILFVPQLFLKTEAHETGWITTGGVLRLIWGVLLIWISMH
jgi:hypothetical protein